ncbi:4Fe-4S dicluster domain-containing protein [Candidatus Sumerlaeota bacterium]|nr:4Fe-4S dicluster domain-containing protein [Candidatus Sumerlaeota bacterium]
MKLIKKNRLKDFLNTLMNYYDVFAPVLKHKKIRFQKISTPEEVILEYSNTHNKPTELFFPQCEVLFEVDLKENIPEQPPKPDKPVIVFGIRPCDARSLQILDKVFHWDGVDDPYYFARRNNAILIVMGCTEPRSTCFCTSVGSGPMDHNGADLFLTELPEAYAIEPVSEKGKAVFEQVNDLLEDATEGELKSLAELTRRAEQMIDSEVNLNGLSDKLRGMFDHPVWDEFHLSCIGCGTCTYLCPTCHCFDILDEKKGNYVRRIRFWDCCMYPYFTLQSSGHNPRPTQKQRVRQRVMHKFQYFVENFGEIACVGCGRCILNCPVNLDIRSILKRLMEVKG